MRTLITPEIGKSYLIHHSSGNIPCEFLREIVYNPPFNANRRSTTHYLFKNERTGREIVIKSRVKILREWAKVYWDS